MALRHSVRHLDPHGHSYGPRRDELHVGSVVTIQNPLQDTHLGGEYKAQRGVSRAGYCRSLRLLCWSELSPAQSQIFRQRSLRTSTSVFSAAVRPPPRARERGRCSPARSSRCGSCRRCVPSRGVRRGCGRR